MKISRKERKVHKVATLADLFPGRELAPPTLRIHFRYFVSLCALRLMLSIPRRQHRPQFFFELGRHRQAVDDHIAQLRAGNWSER